MLKRTLTVESPYLHIPIKTGSPKNELQLWVGGCMLYQFSVELSDNGPYQHFFLDVSRFMNTTLDLIVPFPDGIGNPALDGVFQGAAPETLKEYEGMYDEPLRPQFHFSSRRGWLNDPNGLYWHNGVYHLYYQHNPLGTLHGSVNVSWGHAVSADLIHWKEHSDAILPWRRDWLIASGSAVIDRNNDAGYGENAVIAAFTCLGTLDQDGKIAPSGGQFLAASTDDGETFYRFSQSPSIGVPDGADWRDPRLFADDGKHYIAVYERREQVNGVSFYSSDNLREWEFKSWTPNLYECPDLFRIKAEETGEETWVLYGADGLARLGEFKDGEFKDSGVHFPLDYGTSTYAGQTWSHEPKGRRVHISWIRGMDSHMEWEQDMGYHGMPFSQCMSIPCEIELHKLDGRYHLCRFPVKELDALHDGPGSESEISLCGSHRLPLAPQSDIRIACSSYDDPIIKLEFAEHTITLNLEAAEIAVDEKPVRRLMNRNPEIRVLTDRTTVELFIGDEVSATYAADTKEAELSVFGTAKLRVHKKSFKSIWHGDV